MFLNRNALLARFLEFLKELLRLIEATWIALQLHPSFTRGNLHAERILDTLQQFDVIGVQRL